MMQELQFAAEMLSCKILTDHFYVPNNSIASITPSGISIHRKENSSAVNAEEILVLAPTPKSAAIGYLRSEVPAWIYFGEGSLRDLELPAKPRATEVFLFINSSEYAATIAETTAANWRLQGRKVTIIPSIKEYDMYAFFNRHQSFQYWGI